MCVLFHVVLFYDHVVVNNKPLSWLYNRDLQQTNNHYMRENVRSTLRFVTFTPYFLVDLLRGQY